MTLPRIVADPRVLRKGLSMLAVVGRLDIAESQLFGVCQCFFSGAGGISISG